MAEDFIDQLREFLQSRDKTLEIPSIQGIRLNLQDLYYQVVKRGGFVQVTNTKLWKEILNELKLQENQSKSIYLIKQYYVKYLLDYEKWNFFGVQQFNDEQTSSRQSSIQKNMAKVKLSTSQTSNTRRLLLAFESRHQPEINWAINVLLMLSCNTANNYILDSTILIDNFILYLYMLYENIREDMDDHELVAHGQIIKKPCLIVRYDQITTTQAYEQAKTMLVILRNLSMVRQNEVIMFRSSNLVDTVINFFTDLIDNEITQNCLEIITNLAKHIFLADLPQHQILLTTLLDCMQSDMAETAIECFRKLSLPLGNEQILELMPQIFFDLLAKWLNSYTPSHNGALEIICSLSDQKLATKVKIANASGCLEQLVKYLTSVSNNDDIEDKYAKMAALILSNLSTAPSNCEKLRQYENQIFMVASVDERLCGLLSTLLYEVNDLCTT